MRPCPTLRLVLDTAARTGTVTSTVVARAHGCSLATAASKLARYHEAGLLEREQKSHHEAVLYHITKAGRLKLESINNLPARPPDFGPLLLALSGWRHNGQA